MCVVVEERDSAIDGCSGVSLTQRQISFYKSCYKGEKVICIFIFIFYFYIIMCFLDKTKN